VISSSVIGVIEQSFDENSQSLSPLRWHSANSAWRTDKFFNFETVCLLQMVGRLSRLSDR
jgi:hypothetical protein